MKKRLKTVLALLLAVATASVLLCGNAWAANSTPEETSPQVMSNVVTGTCGKNLTWTLNRDTGVLTISGTGAMANDCNWDSYSNKIKQIVIKKGVTSIAADAFWSCPNLTKVSLPQSLKKIGACAFGTCKKLSAITLPASLTSLGDNAFFECRSLTKISIPKGVSVIRNDTFSYCTKLSSVTITNGVTKIQDWAFSYSGLTSVTIPKSVTGLSTGAFKNCKKLKSIVVNKDNKKYASKSGILFNKTIKQLLLCPEGKTGTYKIPSGVTGIGKSAFEGSKLSEVTIPGSVASIKHSCFLNSSTKKITLENGVKTLAPNAFYGSCATTVIFPASITSLGDALFLDDDDCVDFDNLSALKKSKNLYFKGNCPKKLVKEDDYNVGTFYGITATAYYPAGNKTWNKKLLNYSGKITWKTWNPYTTTLTKVTPGKKQATVRWKQGERISGYQVQYATNSKFSKPKATLVKGMKKTSVVLKKLQGKKKYFFRIRTYRMDGKKKCFSAWSASKAATVKN